MALENKWSVIKIVQELLAREPDKSSITPSLISKKIDLVLMLNPLWSEGLDRDAVTEELIRRFSIWVGVDGSLVDMKGHIPWLTADRKKDWRYWQRYREWQELKLSWAAVESMDKTTDHIIGMLEDPRRADSWDRRGMVVGHVQSGKTGNYTGVICKAADAGYKIIIVLAGLHNNLRSQTQMRLDEGFLGYETSSVPENGSALIGVGKIDSSPSLRPQYVTNRTETGDFNTKFAKNLGISPEERPWLFVVKKNKTVLTRLLHWIHKHVAETVDPDTGKPLVTHLPLLMIDDEADHASVDTGENVVDADGVPDNDHSPKAINSLIRQILHSFSRKAYVGYTATPFANIFIHERGHTANEGPDLFPSAFITNLAAPSSYVGPSRLFGLETENGRAGALDLVRSVDDHCEEDGRTGWMPARHKSSHIPLFAGQDTMPDSLTTALHSFILACTIRSLRGHGNEHCSMLIHVTRFNLVQGYVHQQVSSYVTHMRQRLKRRIDHQVLLKELEKLWHDDFLSTTESICSEISDKSDYRMFDWNSVIESLPNVLDEIEVRMINGTAKDALDYSDSPTGIKVIAIGGDKLARGLTLEGLCVSYFLRATKMYDTLMQMGRWFGYRTDYLDLCRLYTTDDLIEWFEHIADASEELRAEFDFMMESNLTPKDYGLKVKSHPVLMVTSPLKMRTAKTLYLSFSGSVVETVTFFRDQSKIKRNYDAFMALQKGLGDAEIIPQRKRIDRKDSWSGVQWSDVSPHYVIEFLSSYETHPDSIKVKSDMLSEFIQEMNSVGELTTWTVAVIGGSVKIPESVGGLHVNRMRRSAKKNDDSSRYSIGRLLSPQDEALDMDEPGWLAALKYTQEKWKPDPGRATGKELPDRPNGPAIRRIKGFGAEGLKPRPDKGLLLISLLDLEAADSSGTSAELRVNKESLPVVAFAISFPFSNASKSVPYMVNLGFWGEQYGASE